MHIPAGAETRAGVLLCHGMESNKDSEKLALLGRSLSERGLAALRFDFFCAGESSGTFERITWSREVEDLKAAFGFLQRRRVRRIGIIGSSMGGSVGLLFASREKKVAALATVAAPLHPKKIIDRILTHDEIYSWRQQGFVTYHGRRINRSFIDDLATIDVPRAARALSCPLLIIHGDADDTVPVEEAHELYTQVSGPKRLCILEGADHRLSDRQALTTALDESLAWMARHLSPVSGDASGS